MANVLVTGGAGYIGSVCCEQLLQQGHAVTVVDDLSTGFAEAVPQGVTLTVHDIGDRAAMHGLLREQPFEIVFHFAAKALIPESVTNPGPFFARNVASGVDMLEMLRAAGVRKFVFSSTAAVYGNPVQVPIPEDHPKNPINSYGESKLMFEQILRWYASAYQWSVVAFRYFNACGATSERGERHDPETHILPLLLGTASGRRDSFKIFGNDYDTRDGTCLRDYVHVWDIARAHLLALGKMDAPGFQVYNIGTGKAFTVREVCDAVEALVQKKLPISLAPRRSGDPAVLCAGPARIQSELNWAPQRSDLNTIIASAWSWEQKMCAAHRAAVSK